MPSHRVTVTLPPEIVRDIDRIERNRSRFVLQAVESELERRRREELRRSIYEPHPESQEVAEAGLGQWGVEMPGGGEDDLLDPGGGHGVSWRPGEGWVEEGE